MKKSLLRCAVGIGSLILLTHTASAEWVQIGNNQLRAFSPMRLAVSGGNLFAGTMGGGVFRCPENDTVWTALNCGSTYVRSLAVSGGSIFAVTSGGVLRSTDNGNNWTPIDSGLANTLVNALAVSGNGNLFAGTGSFFENGHYHEGGVFLSTNDGSSWTAVNSGLPANTSVWSFCVSGNTIFAGTDSDGVFLSVDNGTSWTKADSGMPPIYFARLAASGNNIFCGGRYGVYRSSNSGANWTAFNSGLPANNWVWCFAVSGGNIFAGTDSGVFVSTISGTRWARCNSGLPNMSVSSLAASESYIFVSLMQSAMSFVWRRPLSEIVGTINGKPQQGKVKPYAGPFKINIGKNGIAVLLPENLNNGAIAVELYAVSGKRIYSAAQQVHGGGLNIPLSGLSTGTYVISMRGTTTTLSSPFVVTK